MFRKHYRQQIPELNTTSTADISFMLLVFFLVTSSMDTDKGMQRQMAPSAEKEQLHDINRELVMQVTLDAHGQVVCNGKAVTLKELGEEVVAMATVNRTSHMITITADREATYESYFRMQDAIVGAYHSLRDRYAREYYGRSYVHCSAEERAGINDYYPQRISEDIQEGGRP